MDLLKIYEIARKRFPEWTGTGLLNFEFDDVQALMVGQADIQCAKPDPNELGDYAYYWMGENLQLKAGARVYCGMLTPFSVRGQMPDSAGLYVMPYVTDRFRNLVSVSVVLDKEQMLDSRYVILAVPEGQIPGHTLMPVDDWKRMIRMRYLDQLEKQLDHVLDDIYHAREPEIYGDMDGRSTMLIRVHREDVILPAMTPTYVKRKQYEEL